jgi:hypothetical protein
VTLAELPLFAALASSERILVAGCGGGFDVYCGVPLALALRRLGKTVTFANLTFANPRSAVGAEVVCEALTRIDATMGSVTPYFPEWYLACWLRDRGEPHDVYCFDRTGVVPLRAAYETLIARERIDAVVVVDGGTDSLMRGDEAGLGTPHEDVATLLALEAVDLPRFLVCLGFGVDAFHGVCHAQFLENTAALSKVGAFLGTFSLLAQQEEGRAYLDLVRFASDQEPTTQSIVNTSVAAAVEGHFGDHHPTERTRGSELFINPLMAIHWCYELAAVVERVLYKDAVANTETFGDLVRIVDGLRRSMEGRRPRRAIPG